MAPSLEDHIVLPDVNPNEKQVQSLHPPNDTIWQKTNHWEHALKEIPGRCDLSGLLKEGQKYRVDLRKPYDTKAQRHVSFPLAAELIGFGSYAAIQLESALQFAWHKALSVYGNGEETVLAVALPGMSELTQLPLALPATVNHVDQQARPCVACIESIVQQTRHMINQQDFVNISCLNSGLFDSSFTLQKSLSSTILQQYFPINCVILDTTGQPPTLTIIYAEELFEVELMKGLADVFLAVLVQLLSTPSMPVADLQLLNETRLRELDVVNDTDGEYPSTKRLNELFEESAAKTPANVAVRYKDRQLTYEELNLGANRLAHYLVSHEGPSVLPEQLVALFLDKSELMILIVLAIWKSGACYSPIEPTYPDARIRFSLEDTGARIIIANHRHVFRLNKIQDPQNPAVIIEVESLLERLVEDGSFPSTNPQLVLNSQQLAYVTYTSGTTGVPKGIQKRHTNVVNSITDLAERYGVRDGHEVVVLFSPYVFEPFARQTLMALLNSHVLVVVDDDTKLDPVAFPKILKQSKITYLNGTASVLQEYDYSDCPELKKLVLVGEDLTEVRYNALRRKFKGRIINEYG
jgi:N-(5-amino-5-carboxypentanoyl)-L-cysteinyl-D-valine synthase